MPDVDVVVVGAGLAGLVAARDVMRSGLQVAVVEARDRVGGRVLNAQLPGGAPIEVGGQWVGPGQTEILDLIAELGLSLFPTHTQGRKVLDFDGRTLTYTGRIPRLHPLVLADIGYGSWRLDRLTRRLPPPGSTVDERAAALDGQTLATWIQRHLHTRGGREFLRLITRAVFTTEPEDLSALWALAYLGANQGLDALTTIRGGALQDRIVGGSQRIALTLAAQLGERVRLNCPVTDVQWGDSGVRISLPNAATLSARRAIIAVPPALSGRIRYLPALPADRDQLIQRMPMGRVIKTNVVYDEPFWRRLGFSGQANSNRRTAATVLDNTPAAGSPGVLVVFTEGRRADAASRLSPPDRRRHVLADLAAYFGPAAKEPIGYIELDWAAEHYTGGCYGAFTAPSTLTRFGAALRAPIGPLHWAGSETARRWTCSMDGAVESGHRTAREVAAVLNASPALTPPPSPG
ncbi:oxidoreductase [Mycobacterium heckeshornense]|uniref:Putative flavin-containing monoamine oxidase AofH n=1 Tax=Mycobacterium heckeshornense TaxID=110505 RepID=A0A2G8BFH2_9MYCO|nr:FAD-dependent oxidoreductase [Mycobacterium heckeshornense]KMV22819.1 oxidoreductase [Mycobacterium heckeshornense]MCV7033852.1 FAD-dependent oxidoreductase [Mycobacterium heckeshornense]PIJ36406.1 oxidoreductase [Mycobacterium heckeshornense]BCO33973.1 putative flavin-containing monoamine oxidase AofH [Mycobacterium heckeshornense]BCQ07022.1 putative flavin-containing monoamine oxidase AofH [Mycobacterium heckeshornense]